MKGSVHKARDKLLFSLVYCLPWRPSVYRQPPDLAARVPSQSQSSIIGPLWMTVLVAKIVASGPMLLTVTRSKAKGFHLQT